MSKRTIIILAITLSLFYVLIGKKINKKDEVILENHRKIPAEEKTLNWENEEKKDEEDVKNFIASYYKIKIRINEKEKLKCSLVPDSRRINCYLNTLDNRFFYFNFFSEEDLQYITQYPFEISLSTSILPESLKLGAYLFKIHSCSYHIPANAETHQGGFEIKCDKVVDYEKKTNRYNLPYYKIRFSIVTNNNEVFYLGNIKKREISAPLYFLDISDKKLKKYITIVNDFLSKKSDEEISSFIEEEINRFEFIRD